MKKCMTPGAFWFFKKDDWTPKLYFSVSVPRELFDALDKRQCEQIEKAFHDAIEPLLGPLWPKTKSGRWAPQPADGKGEGA